MDELFFSVYIVNEHPQRIFHSRKINGVWQKPKLVSFSGTYQDGGPKLSSDGKTVYFYSKRPNKEGEETLDESRIWYSKKGKDGWNSPKLLEIPANLGISFHASHYSSDGVFYFGIEVIKREYEMYKCIINDSKPTEIERMNEPFSMKGVIEGGAITDPENKVLIFDSYDRYGNKEDLLHISKKLPDGSWSEPKLLPEIYNRKHGRFAKFTPDGKYFFFCSYRNGYEQIFWVKSEAIFELVK